MLTTLRLYRLRLQTTRTLERNTVETDRMDIIAVVVCMAKRAARMLMTANVESIGAPFSEVMFGLDNKEALTYNSTMQVVLGTLTVIMFIIYAGTSYTNWISERLNCYRAMIALRIFHLSTMPFLLGNVEHCERFMSNIEISASATTMSGIEQSEYLKAFAKRAALELMRRLGDKESWVISKFSDVNVSTKRSGDAACTGDIANADTVVESMNIDQVMSMPSPAASFTTSPARSCPSPPSTRYHNHVECLAYTIHRASGYLLYRGNFVVFFDELSGLLMNIHCLFGHCEKEVMLNIFRKFFTLGARQPLSLQDCERVARCCVLCHNNNHHGEEEFPRRPLTLINSHDIQSWRVVSARMMLTPDPDARQRFIVIPAGYMQPKETLDFHIWLTKERFAVPEAWPLAAST